MQNARRIEITSRTILKIILGVLAMAGLFYFRSFVLIIFLSVILAAIVNRFAHILKKIKIPRIVSIILFYLLFLSFLFLIVYFFLPSVVIYLGNTLDTLPDLLNTFKAFTPVSSAWYSNFLTYLIDQVQAIDVNSVAEQIKAWILNTSIANSSSIITSVVYFFITLVIAFYISLSENGIPTFIRMISPKKYEDYLISLFIRVERKLSSWFIGQMLVALLVALVIYIILLVFKIPYPLPIAALAALFELLPFLGITLAAIPAVFFAWNIGGMSLVVLIILSFFLVSQLSSYLFYPKIVGKFVNMPTVIVIIAVFAGAEMAGFWGALIAIPVTTVLMEIVSDYNKFKTGSSF